MKSPEKVFEKYVLPEESMRSRLKKITRNCQEEKIKRRVSISSKFSILTNNIEPDRG
jgi:hypothetical protein